MTDTELVVLEEQDTVEAGVIELDGVNLWLAGNSPQNLQVQFSDLARFQPKILFGDPSKDDNDLLSVLQMSDFSGGHGVFELKEGTDQQRFNFSTLTTRFPGAMTRPPYVRTHDEWDVAGDVTPLGEYYNTVAPVMQLVLQVNLDVWTVSTTDPRAAFINPQTLNGTGADRGTLSAPAVNKGTAFRGTNASERFFIPCGTGFAWFAEGTSLTNVNSPDFIDFAVWDNKLIGIDADGQLYWSLNGTTWSGGTDGDSYGVTYKLSKSYVIRGLAAFFDRQDEAAMFVITNRDIWQFNPDGPELFRIDFGWPAHPYSGLAWAVWSGQLFVSIGMGVMRYSGGTWMPVGLDRDYGLPNLYRGHIVDMASGFNALYALVQSDDLDPDYGGRSSVHEFTGAGWHCLWVDDAVLPEEVSVPLTVNKIVVTQAGGSHFLAWGTGGSDDSLYTMNLPFDFANPRSAQGNQDGFFAAEFSDTYYWESGWFDADMFGYIKIANTFQISVDDPENAFGGGGGAGGTTVVLEYRTERDEDWERLGSLGQDTLSGRYTFAFGDPITRDGGTSGLPFVQIQFRVSQVSGGGVSSSFGTNQNSVIIANMVFTFLKTVASNDAFTVSIDTSRGSADGELNNRELEAWIDSLTTVKRFLPLVVGSEEYRVFISQNLGARSTGDLQIGQRQLSLVEIPSSSL